MYNLPFCLGKVSVARCCTHYMKVAWQTGCQICSKRTNPVTSHLLLTSSQTVRCHNTKTEPQEENYKSSKGDISLEQGVRLSRQGCSTVPPPSPTGPPRKRAKVKDVPQRKEWTLPEGYDTGIRVYNTLTRQKEQLILPQGRVATW